SLYLQYYAESHAVIYIVDSSDRDRIPDSKETFDKVISSEHLIGVPLLVLANKQDVPDCMGVREVKPIFNQNAHLIGRRDCMVMPVSALNGDGVDEGIHWLVDCVKRNSDIRPPRNQDDNSLS
ncbi:ADP-ribosylation factor-related protein 1, partial [Cyphomyrmex costatus]